MSFFKHLYKIVSYIFIGFIVILITITFGMPDFISTSVGSDEYIAVQIDDEILTKAEVSRTRNRYFREKFPGADLPKGFREHVENQVLDQMIENKIFIMLLQDIGLYPIERSKSYIMSRYLKENFSTYFSDSIYEPEKFKKEVLRPNRISYSDLEEDVINSSSSQDIHSLFDSINLENSLEKILFWEMTQGKLSYQIAVLNNEKKKKILESRVAVTEKEIQDSFQKETVSKDSQAKLTSTKRNTIRTKLLGEKTKKIEQQWLDSLKDLVKKGSLKAAAAKYGLKIYKLLNVALSDKLDGKKPTGAPYLGDLDKARSFHEFIVSSDLNEPNVIIEKKNIYLVNIINRRKTSHIDYNKVFKEEKEFIKFIEKNKKDLTSEENDLSTKNHSTMLKGITDLQKKNSRIKRNL